MLPRPLPTPLLAFAIRELGCVAGVMVTASHNPPQDNGYKVYLGDGSQIVPPADAEIAARIAAVGAAGRRPARRRRRRSSATRSSTATSTRVADLAGDGPRDLRIVYTPLHGVGGTSVLAGAGARRLRRAARRRRSRSEPDPDFPTVAFPNPEEPGAMDLAMALAAEIDADLVVANDPDADRCAVAVAGRRTAGGCCAATRSARCSAHHLLAQRHASGIYATSIVSSSLLGKMAASRGPAVRRDAHRLQVDRPRRRASPSATRRRSATASTPST